MSQRIASVQRNTQETHIEMELNMDGRGRYDCTMELGFFKHMLELLARHARLDLKIKAGGDLEVDDHHLTEDMGITLGLALNQALGEKRGISRYGSVLMPMDEVLVAVALDLGGRFAFCCDYQPQRERVGDLSTEQVSHFFRSLALEARMALHFNFLNPGENEHHRVESMFKGFARSLRMAAQIDEQAKEEIPSTKGVL